MAMLYSNLSYYEVCYKGTALHLYCYFSLQEPRVVFEDIDATELYPCVTFYSSNPGEKVRHMVRTGLKPRGPGFEPHQCHCFVFLSKTHLSLLSTGSTQEDTSRHN